ncbi:MAG: Uncharacterized protein Athens071424_194 [Parcubacteria group bacterium Athens0714_24]|nr:MAG: Uncharacterized protein Athens071424_194 [Parcubacteria group bacterium Athens0714_24]
MTIINFKPINITNNLTSVLKDRNRDILSQRFGIGNSNKKKTLDAIGKQYGITRERVRQIVNFAVNSIKESPAMDSAEEALLELKDIISKKGRLLSEKEILESLSSDPAVTNHIYFLLVLGDDFKKFKEDEEFNHRWTVDDDAAEKIHNALRQLHSEINEDDIISESEILNILNKKAEKIVQEKVNEEILRSWLNLSHVIASNPMGEWGLSSSPSISPRGVKDLTFLILRKQGSAMHFSEVAKNIKENFSKSAHLATVHNELIKDDRFVLVGRGLYALKDWGYRPGTARDVIKEVIKTNGPMKKEDIVKSVLKERYIKENTILINLHNRDFFRRNKEGKYAIV